MSRDRAWVKVTSVADPMEAELFKALFENFSIPVLLRHDGITGFDFRGRVEDYELYVPPDYVPEAKRRLDEYYNGDSEYDGFWD